MKITLIEPRGFCFGVCRALKMLDEQVQKRPYVLHEIVHNKQIIKDYQAKGVTFIDDLSAVPDGAQLVLSAHGVAQSVEAQARARFNVTDTTCPFVAKIHTWIRKLESQNIPVILIGKANHAEIVGSLGQLKHPEKAFIISDINDVQKLPDMPCVGIATQTTLSVRDTAHIIEAIKQRFDQVILQSGICLATQERQKAVENAAKTHKMILVVGDEKSSNAKRLVETAKNAGAAALLIEKVQDLQQVNLPDSVAITAAASAPETIVLQVYEALKNK